MPFGCGRHAWPMLVIYQCTKKGFARASTYSFVIGSSNAPTQALSSRTCLTSAACLGERQWHEDWVYDGQRKITSRHGVDSRPLWEWQKDAWHAAVGVRGFPLRGLARAELSATAKRYSRACVHHNARLSTSWRGVISHSPRAIPCFDGSVVIRRVAPFSAVKAMRLAGHFDIDIELRRGTLGAGYNHVFGDFRGPPQ
jgi:hypothetical protein